MVHELNVEITEDYKIKVIEPKRVEFLRDLFPVMSPDQSRIHYLKQLRDRYNLDLAQAMRLTDFLVGGIILDGNVAIRNYLEGREIAWEIKRR